MACNEAVVTRAVVFTVDGDDPGSVAVAVAEVVVVVGIRPAHEDQLDR